MTAQAPILFAAGPGDVEGTYGLWHRGARDTSIPALTYSEQIYDAVAAIGRPLEAMTQHPVRGNGSETVSFHHLPASSGGGAAYHRSEIRNAAALARRAVEIGAGAVIVQRMFEHYWPLRHLMRRRIPFILSLHNSLWPINRTPSAKERILVRLNLPVFRGAARILCVSQGIADQLVSIGVPANRIAVHVPKYHEDRRALWQPRPEGEGLHSLLYLGRMERNKGVFDLLAAFEALAGEHPSLTLHYLGTGSAEAEMRHRAAASPVAARIVVSGHASGEGVFAALSEADLLVCPTTRDFAEGLAKTPIEAALHGRPSIVSDVVPVGTLLPGASLIVPADDPGALGRAIQELIGDPARMARMIAATHAEREQFFGPERSFRSEMAKGLEFALAGRGRRAGP